MMLCSALIVLLSLGNLVTGEEAVPFQDLLEFGSALLNSDFMPPNLLLAPLTEQDNEPVVEEEVPLISAPSAHAPLTNASIDLALSTMTFHRQRIADYLCRGYVARAILEDIQQSATEDELKKQQALAQEQTPSQHRPGRQGDSLRAKLLMADPGSLAYRNWLKRSANLEGVYRKLERRRGYVQDTEEDDSEEEDAQDEDEEVEEEGPEDERDEELQVVEEEKIKNQNLQSTKRPRHRGRLPKPKKKKKKKPPTRPRQRPKTPAPLDSETSSQEHSEPEYAEPYEVPGEVVFEDWTGLGFNMKDMYDITLTAVAFLAFGIFVLNVFINIITTRVGPMNLMVVTNSSTVAPSLPVRFREGPWWEAGQDEEVILERIARWAGEPSIPEEHPAEMAAKYALLSFNAAIRDRPECLQMALCRGNRDTRELQGEARYWLPIWSVGMSWLGRRRDDELPDGSSIEISEALENLRASVLGLAGVTCSELFEPCR